MTMYSDKEYVDFFASIVGRPEVELLTNFEILENFENSRILIVGAGGTIGSSLSSRLVRAGIPNVFFLDRDESALHALTLGLSNISASLSKNCVVGDIRDLVGMRNSISSIKPTIVIHAAALKHLVILERFPREGFLSNIIGTFNVATACRDLEVNQFINISTDKAANPISVLGKTKKIAELVTEEVLLGTNTAHASVRFGNVFASRGSVIETFIHQILNDLPVTITDQMVSRFFMSRNEAANLVLAAATLEESGTYIQNMGEEVLISQVISRLSKHFHKEVKLQVIGLQSGEKLSETLFDGPALETKFPDISKSAHEIRAGITKAIESASPTTDAQALLIIEGLVSKFI